MKRIYNYIKNLIVTKYKFARRITFILFLISIISVFYHHLLLTPVMLFGGSFMSLVRMRNYSIGYLKFFTTDRSWWRGIKYRDWKNMSDEMKDEIYKKYCLKSATIHFIVAVAGLFLWIHVELLVFLSSLI